MTKLNLKKENKEIQDLVIRYARWLKRNKFRRCKSFADECLVCESFRALDKVRYLAELSKAM